jgi:hypothetical protein
MVLQCINGVGSNPVEGRTQIWQLSNLILTLFGLIFRRIYDYEYVTLVVNTSQSISHSRRITWLETRLPWRVSPVDQELITLQGHLRLHPVFSGGFSGVRLTRSLVLCACFINRCLSFCNFSFGHFVVYSSSIYGFRLPLWYLLPHPAFSGVCVAQGLVVYLMLYRYVFVPLSFFFWTLYCLLIFGLWLTLWYLQTCSPMNT